MNDNIDSDVNKGKFKSKNFFNLLGPLYEVNVNEEKKSIMCLIPKSNPTTNYSYTSPDLLGLKINDIEVATAGSLNKSIKFTGLND